MQLTGKSPSPTYADALLSFVEDGADLERQISVLRGALEGEVRTIEEAVICYLLAARLAQKGDVEAVVRYSQRARRAYSTFLGFTPEEIANYTERGLLGRDDQRYAQCLAEKFTDEPCDQMILVLNWALDTRGPESFRDDLSASEKREAYLSAWRDFVERDHVVLALGAGYFRAGHLDEAIRVFEGVVRGPRAFDYDPHKSPDIACVVRTLFGDLYAAAGRMDEAIQQWRKVASITADDLESRCRPALNKATRLWIEAAKTKLGRLSPATGDPSQAQKAMKRAYIILTGLEKDFDEFRSRISAMVRELNQTEGFRGLVKGLSSRLAIRKERKEITSSIDLASTELETASKIDADAFLETERGIVNVQQLKASVDRCRGNLSLISGNYQEAIFHYETALTKFEDPDVYFLLGLTYEDARQPGMALRAYDKCSKLIPDEETGVEALKNAQRLKSRMFMGGWFVGSWKVFLVLAGLAVLFGVVGIKQGEPAAIAPFVIMAGSAIGYWFAKFRRPATGVASGPQLEDASEVRKPSEPQAVEKVPDVTHAVAADLGGSPRAPLATAEPSEITRRPSKRIVIGVVCSLVVIVAVLLLNYLRSERPQMERKSAGAEKQQVERGVREVPEKASPQGRHPESQARRSRQEDQLRRPQREETDKPVMEVKQGTDPARRQTEAEAEVLRKRQEEARLRIPEEQAAHVARPQGRADEARRQSELETLMKTQELERLREDIILGLTQALRQTGLGEVSITVSLERSVTLTGRVNDFHDRDRAVSIAKTYPGVSGVKSEIRIRREEMKKAIQGGAFE